MFHTYSEYLEVPKAINFEKMQGCEAKWRDELGYEEDDRYNRKAIGDFACYLVFVNSIHAR